MVSRRFGTRRSLAPPTAPSYQLSRNGSVRRRFPVSANTALATAGAIGGVPGSPAPPICRLAGHDDDIDARASPACGARGSRGSSTPGTRPSFMSICAVQRRRQAVDDAGLHLRDHAVGVDRQPAVDGADHPVHADACRASTDTSATCATTLPNDRAPPCRAPCRSARGLPQPGLLDGGLEHAPGGAGDSLNSARRSSTGSRLAACASSSMNDSIANAVWVLPTERHQSTGSRRRRRMQRHQLRRDRPAGTANRPRPPPPSRRRRAARPR